MKTLLLLRHAKSSWKHSDKKDFDRPLNKRGEKDAPRVGKLLVEEGLIPQIILSSTALRARKTTEAVVEASGYAGEVVYLDSLYLAEPSVYLDMLHLLPDTVEQVMVVGHNPGLEALVQILSHEVKSMPTAALAVLRLPVEHWSELSSDAQAELVKVWRPRES